MKTCAICEQPGHRYGSTDPYHESVASACINSLKRRVAELEAENNQLLPAYRKRGVEIARLQLENNRLREALDWIEAEPEDPHKVQQRARKALGKPFPPPYDDWNSPEDADYDNYPDTKSEFGVLDDGFGNIWYRCKKDCGLQIVRPGKVQCECEDA